VGGEGICEEGEGIEISYCLLLLLINPVPLYGISLSPIGVLFVSFLKSS